MTDELMSAIDYTPTTDVVRHALTFPRLRLGEPRHMTPEAFDRWFDAVRADVFDEALVAIVAYIPGQPEALNPYRKEEP